MIINSRLFILIMSLGMWVSIRTGYTQLDNSKFHLADSLEPPLKNKVFMNFSSLGFFKNNEYFNNIADGYTLFGYHFAPSLSFYPSEHISLKAGFFAWQDFGNHAFSMFQPLFTVRLEYGDMLFQFGTLDPPASHLLIEPIYDFERNLTSPLENGMRFVYDHPRIRSEVWINWEDMLYRGEGSQEKLSAGLSAVIRAVGDEVMWIEVPVQLLVWHHGGQIDASPLPMKTTANGAAGFSIGWMYQNNRILRKLGFSCYLAGYKDFSNTLTEPFRNGFGGYVNGMLSTSIVDLMLSYWHGDRYICDYGGDLYSSVSSTYKNPLYYEKTRDLIIVRFSRDIRLFSNFYITARVEPVLDINDPAFEFSHGLYFNYRGNFLLGKTKD